MISYDEALKWASNPDEFKLKKIGVQSVKEMSMEEMEKRISDISKNDGVGESKIKPSEDAKDPNLLDIDKL